MLSSLFYLLLLPSVCFASGTPVVTVKNGSYSGVYNPTYNQDFFLGIPYAQVGWLPQHLTLVDSSPASGQRSSISCASVFKHILEHDKACHGLPAILCCLWR
jgi:hypothetical protein